MLLHRDRRKWITALSLHVLKPDQPNLTLNSARTLMSKYVCLVFTSISKSIATIGYFIHHLHHITGENGKCSH